MSFHYFYKQFFLAKHETENLYLDFKSEFHPDPHYFHVGHPVSLYYYRFLCIYNVKDSKKARIRICLWVFCLSHYLHLNWRQISRWGDFKIICTARSFNPIQGIRPSHSLTPTAVISTAANLPTVLQQTS